MSSLVSLLEVFLGGVRNLSLSWIPDPLELDIWTRVERSPQLCPQWGLSLYAKDPGRQTLEAEESRHPTLGTALATRLNPLQPSLLLARQKYLFHLCTFACPSAQFGHHSRSRQPPSSGPVLSLFPASFPLFFLWACMVGCP